MKLRSQIVSISLLLFAMANLAGCQALYFLQGKGDQDALYKFPPNKRLLVFVDPRSASRMPADLPYSMGESISDMLFKYTAADRFVSQQKLTEVRRTEGFEKLGIADVARMADADVVLHVDVIQWKVEATADGSITSGLAAVIVKVISREGVRMWPPEGMTGVPIEARIDPQLSEQQSIEQVNKAIVNLLTIRVSRMFFKYDLENRELTK